MAQEGYLLRRLVDGLAGWSTYEQARKAGDKFEADFDAPLTDIAHRQYWKVQRQQKLEREVGTKGGTPRVDFLFWRKEGDFRGKNPGMLLVEVKCLKGGKAASEEISRIGKDIKRLQTIQTSDLEGSEDFQACGKLVRFLLIAAQKKAFSDVKKIKAKKHPAVVEMIKEGWRSPGDDVYYASANTYLRQDLGWHVYAFGKKAWPKM